MKPFHRKFITAILQSNLNARFQKLELPSLTRQFSRLVINSALNIKTTDKQNYLHSNSEHPRSMKNSIAYSQVLGLNKICHSKRDLEKSCQKLLKPLSNRGYDISSTLTKLLRFLGMKFCIKIQQRAMKRFRWL